MIHKKPVKASDLRDKHTVNTAQRHGWSTDTMEKKHDDDKAHQPTSAVKRRLDEETENFRHERVPGALRRAIAQARQEKKMTQAQLAHAMSERQQVVQEYESGKAIPDGRMIAKMSRILGVNLRARAMQ